MIRTLPLMMAGLLALAATGCGTSGVPVSGSVKYGENPMALGLITIEPQAGKAVFNGSIITCNFAPASVTKLQVTLA